MNYVAFAFLGLAFISLWIRRNPKIWGPLLGISLASGLISGNLLWLGLIIIAAWGLLWMLYKGQTSSKIKLLLFATIVLVSFGFKLHLFPGFSPLFITPKFLIGFAAPIVGFFPLALFVYLAKTRSDWKKALWGSLIGCVGIALLALCAVACGAVHWQFKLPSFPALRYLNNLIFVAIPEEGFYRGFMQNEFARLFKNTRYSKYIALLITSLIFTSAHIYWSPSPAILGFVFLSSLLYGGVYLISKKIESAIICHFLLNVIHMTFFSYHAM